MSRELSKIQELALIGHVISDELVFNIVDTLGINILGPNQQTILRRIKEFHQKHHSHPSELELRSILNQEDSQMASSVLKTVDEAIQIKKQVRIETIQPQILLMAERQLLATKMQNAANLYNKSLELFNKAGGSAGEKEHQESKDIVQNINLEFQKLALAVTGGRFESMGSRAGSERAERLSRASRIIPTGIQYLDDATSGGIAPQDLWIISAQSGAGKTQSALSIAVNAGNTNNNRQVSYFALEAEKNELERRYKFTLMLRAYNKANPGNNTYLDMPAWLKGEPYVTSVLDPYDDEANDEMLKNLKNVRTFYRGYGKYTITELERDVASCGSESDLILIDHLGYVDIDNNDENRGVVDMMHRLRDLSSIGRGVPIIAATQTRKGDGKTPRRFAPLLPSMEDINGSKSIITCATHVVTLGRVYEPVIFSSQDKSSPGCLVQNPTLIHLQKFRPADRIRHTALCSYNEKTGTYYKSYVLGRTTQGDTKWEPVDPAPPWAMKYSNLGIIEPIEPKKLDSK